MIVKKKLLQTVALLGVMKKYRVDAVVNIYTSC